MSSNSARKLRVVGCPRWALLLLVLLITANVTRLGAQARRSPAVSLPRLSPDTSLFGALQWREIGPSRGGRSVAVAGSGLRPFEYWMGTTGGGVYKTTDGGMRWAPVTDKYFGGTIGAIAVDQQNPDVVWVGGGETDIRGNTSHGDGLWKSTDAGKTWSMLGFRDEHISTIRIHPTNANVAFIGVFGNPFKAGEARGLFKTTDGGKTFDKILYVNDSTGVIDIAMDPSNPDVMFVAMWQAYRTSWALSSGGVHSAIYKTTDGGKTWANLMKTARGIPTGVLGKIGVAISPAKPSRVWAMIEHDSGGVYRSDDGGASWQYLNRDRKLRQRAWYYTQIYADPKDTNIVYGLNTGIYRSRDGGKTFAEPIPDPHGDNHDLWIAPNDPQRMVNGNDGGANVSYNGGKSWTNQEFPTAQFYHVTTTNEYPYRICGAQQDNSTLCGPSRKPGGIARADWYDAGGCESGYIAAHPLKPNVTFAGCYGGYLERRDRLTGFSRDISVYPNNPMGESSKDIKTRFQWTFPIVFSRHNPNVLYAAGSRLFRSTNEGESWAAVSPDLSRHEIATMGASGGPITKDQTGVETYALIFAFDESPVTPGLLWVGTDDGLVWLSRNNGADWENVTPKEMGDFTRISIIEPSRYAAGTAYIAANRYALGDKRPILYKTTDYGKSWTHIESGIAADHFTRVIREDPVRRGLLFAGTERGVYASFDDGAQWQRLQRNLPLVPVHDLAIRDNDLIAAAHGRSFWVLDDITPLRQLSAEVAAKKVNLFKPADPYRNDWGGNGAFVGANPPSGAIVQYALATPNQKVTLDFLDAAGKVIQSFTSDQDPETAADSVRDAGLKAARVDSLVRAGLARDSAAKVADTIKVVVPEDEGRSNRGPRPPRVPDKAGLNRFAWNLRYPDAVYFDGLIMWAASTTGPVAPPGAYSARLAAGGETQTQSFRVRKDPRSTATDADLLEQFKMLIAIRDQTTEANNAVRMARNMRWNVGDRTGKLNAQQKAEFSAIADQMMNGVTRSEESVYQTKNRSDQDPLNFPIRLNNKIAALAGVVGSGEYRPTQQSREVYAELVAKLDAEVRAMNTTIDENLPRLNAILKAAGLQELRKSTEQIRGPKPNVAM